MNGVTLKKEDLVALGYNELDHAGFSWLASKQGVRFLLEVEDWSEQALALREGWITTKRRYHLRYFAKDRHKNPYFIKAYCPKEKLHKGFARGNNRARREFCNTLFAYQEGIQTVLPLAFGSGEKYQGRGIIIYPFLDNSTTLPTLYKGGAPKVVGVAERQSLERKVGRMVRQMVNKGLYPRDLVLDHFLIRRVEKEESQVYWVDLERIKFGSLFRRRKGVVMLARLLAQMQRLKNSGYQMNHSSMMRVAHAFFDKKSFNKLDKRICNRVIRAARKFWRRKGWDTKRPEGVMTIDI